MVKSYKLSLACLFAAIVAALAVCAPQSAFAAESNTPSDPVLTSDVGTNSNPIVYGAPITYQLDQTVKTTTVTDTSKYKSFAMYMHVSPSMVGSFSTGNVKAYKIVDGVSTDITAQGTPTWTASTGVLKFTFSDTYAESMDCNGETYRVTMELTPTTDLSALAAYANADKTLYTFTASGTSSVLSTGAVDAVLKDSNTLSSIEKIPMLSVSKSAGGISKINVGKSVLYTVRVSQTAVGAIAKNVTIDDALDAAAIDDGATIDATSITLLDKNGTPVGYTLASSTAGHIVLKTNASLDAGDYLTLSYKGLFGSTTSTLLLGTSVVNTATASADNTVSPTNDKATVSVLAPVVIVNPTVNKDTANCGDTVKNTVHVTETAPEAQLYNPKSTVALDAASTGNGARIDGNSISVSYNGTIVPVSNVAITKTIDASTGNIVGFVAAVSGDAYSIGANDTLDISYDTVLGTSSDKNLENTNVISNVETTGDNLVVPSKGSSSIYVEKPVLNSNVLLSTATPSAGDTVTVTDKTTQSVIGGEAKNVAITESFACASGTNDVVKTFQNVKAERDGIPLVEGIDYTIDKSQLDKIVILTNKSLTETDNITVTYDVVFGTDASTDLNGKAFTASSSAIAYNTAVSVASSATINVATPLLTIAKTANSDVINVGDNADYTITVKNTESAAVAKNIAVTDALSSDSVSKGAFLNKDVKVMSNDSELVEGTDYTITYTTASNLVNGFSIKLTNSLSSSTTLTIKYTVTAGTAENTQLRGVDIANTANASASNVTSSASPSATETITVASAKLKVEKTSDKATLNKNDSAIYTVKVTNADANASSVAKNIAVEDSLAKAASDIGYKMDASSLKVLDGEGNDITSQCTPTWTGGTAFAIHTASALAQGKTLTVTYTAKTTDVSDNAYSTTLMNTALAHADNAAYSSATVSVSYSGKTPNGNSTASNGVLGGNPSLGGTVKASNANTSSQESTSKTGDTLPFVFAGIFIVGAGIWVGTRLIKAHRDK